MKNAMMRIVSAAVLCCPLVILSGCGGEKESAARSSEPAPVEQTTPAAAPSQTASSPVPTEATPDVEEAAAQVEGDAVRGKRVFAKCAVCHSVEEGKTAFGPSLYKFAGTQAGQAAGYTYSSAMAGADIVWTDEALDEYLTNPAKYLPGNKMAFPGLPSAQERADVIAYLKSIE